MYADDMGAHAFIPRSLNEPETLARSSSRSRGAEAWALLLFAAAIFLILAMVTLHVEPGTQVSSGADWMGAVGASLSLILALGFGAAAWWIPLELLLMGAPLLKGRRPEVVGLRLAGDLLILVLIASLFQVAAPQTIVFGGVRPGGNVGLFFGELMRGLFSAPGSFLVGATAIGLILIGRSSFSFIEWCERARLFYHSLLSLLARAALAARQTWTSASAVRAQQLRESSLIQKTAEKDPDAAILTQLQVEIPWIPLEATGTPPLAVSESLRQSLGIKPTWVGEGEGTPECEETEDCEESSSRSVPVEPCAFVEATSFTDVDPATSPPTPEETISTEPPSVDGFWQGVLDDDSEQAPEVVSLDGQQQEEATVERECPGVVAAAESAASLTEEPKIVSASPEQITRVGTPEAGARLPTGYEFPQTHLLDPPDENDHVIDRAVVLRYADLLEKTLADYGVTGKVEEIHPGPTVTTYEVAPSPGTKVSKVAGLSDDLALGLSRKVRIIAPIPGKSRIGFEIPNDERIPVNLRELVEDERFADLAKKVPLPVVLGRDIVGKPFYADLSSMPHVIVAGATGAGKSVGLNVMLSSLLFKRSPEDLRLLMIDPKVVELAPFDKIPHLLLPVVTDMNQASQALKWAVDEMERRYHLFANAGTKNISTFNRYVSRVRSGELAAPKVTEVEVIDHNGDLTSVPVSKKGSDGIQLPDKLPYIVIVVDEFADLIMQQGKEVEASVARLAQKARAAGMHVILATQRPSVDVITGMIKANFPSRIAFRVAQKVDSRTILDEMGAEVLLGRGDKLVKLNGATDTRRVQCPFISEEEVSALTDHLRLQAEPQYDEAILQPLEDEKAEAADEKVDVRFDEAVLIVRDSQRCSTSWLQRKMTIGYNRAAKIVDMMEARGLVGPPNGSKDREVILMP